MRVVISLLVGALLVLSPAARAQSAQEYPEDPSGAVVVDRDNLNLDEHVFYAVLYTEGKQSYLDVYKGLPWQRIHHWPIEFQGEKVVVGARSVLHIDKREDEDVLDFYWSSFAGYQEGAVHQSLSYDRKTGAWKTNWSD